MITRTYINTMYTFLSFKLLDILTKKRLLYKKSNCVTQILDAVSTAKISKAWVGSGLQFYQKSLELLCFW